MNARNPYVNALGVFAAVALGLTAFGVVITLLSGSGADAVSVLGSPAGLAGAVLGALWLVTKAITWQISPPSAEPTATPRVARVTGIRTPR